MFVFVSEWERERERERERDRERDKERERVTWAMVLCSSAKVVASLHRRFSAKSLAVPKSKCTRLYLGTYRYIILFGMHSTKVFSAPKRYNVNAYLWKWEAGVKVGICTYEYAWVSIWVRGKESKMCVWLGEIEGERVWHTTSIFLQEEKRVFVRQRNKNAFLALLAKYRNLNER